MRKIAAGWLLIASMGLGACVRNQPVVVVVTSTPDLQVETQAPDANGDAGPAMAEAPALPDTPSLDELALIQPTPDPTRLPQPETTREYIVQAGDTLSAIAAAQGVSVSALLEVNELPNPNIIAVGQVIRMPELPDQETSGFKIIPDSGLVRGPGSSAVDVGEFVSQQPGYIRRAVDEVRGETLPAAQIVQRVSLEYSVDARLLLALLEYRAGWLTNPDPDEDAQVYPMGAPASPLGFDRNGLYRQLTWTADRLNRGYYGWKYGRLNTAEFESGERFQFAPGLNAGTVGVQHLLSLHNGYTRWLRDITPEGFYRTYVAYFGDPFAGAVEQLVPLDLEQPPLALPFPSDEIWFYTGGPHGGWGSGSAWAAVDFAPPDDLTQATTACYLSEHWSTAVAPGLIARTDEGVVVLDLDGDGDESTGWSILYLHIAAEDRIEAGTYVQPGDRIGRPSCEGGFSTGTHIHIARRYNGEWIPADCSDCPVGKSAPAFAMSGWTVVGIPGQEYQGYLVNGPERRIANQGRLTTDNLIGW
jgi:LasA protease